MGESLREQVERLTRENRRLKMEGPRWAVNLCRSIALHLPGQTDPQKAVHEAAEQINKLQWAYQELAAQIDNGTIPVVGEKSLAH